MYDEKTHKLFSLILEIFTYVWTQALTWNSVAHKWLKELTPKWPMKVVVLLD